MGSPNTGLAWIKSSRTNNPTLDWCLEFSRATVQQAMAAGAVVDGKTDSPYLILVRDSKNLDATPLAYTPEEFAAAVLGFKAGEFDHLVEPEVFARVESAQLV